MNVERRTVVVTGGASGIGTALCHAFHEAGARKVIVADLDLDRASDVASGISGHAMQCDVSDEAQVINLIRETEDRFGPIDLFCNNAGILGDFDPDCPNVAASSNEMWQRIWQINVMSHVFAARQLVPRMRGRGGGYFLNTASAAGLLTAVGGAPYAVSKHAALAFGECLAIAHREHGIKVSMLCPQAVDTPMLRIDAGGPLIDDGIISASDVAQAAIKGIEEERFLILPHQKVQDYMAVKVKDYDRWIGGMAKIQAKMRAA